MDLNPEHWRPWLQENDRLLDLLGRMDAERTQLQREKAALVGEVVELRAAAPEEGAGGPGPEGGGDMSASGQLRQQLAALQVRLAEEQAKRHEVRWGCCVEGFGVLRGAGQAARGGLVVLGRGLRR